MGNLVRIIFCLIPAIYAHAYSGWPIWLSAIAFFASVAIPFIGWIIEQAVWFFALAAVMRSPFSVLSLIFYVLLVIYEWSVVNAYIYYKNNR